MLDRVREQAAGLLRSEAARLYRRLAALAIPPLHHEDFRSGNVLSAPDGTLILLDWNDTVITPLLQRAALSLIHPSARHQLFDGNEDLRRSIRAAIWKSSRSSSPGAASSQRFTVVSAGAGPRCVALRVGRGPR